VQVGRITGRYQTRLDKLLSVFEQSNFIDNKKITKQFKHPTDDEDVKIMTDILQHAGSNPEERKLLENEQEALRTLDAMFGRKNKELKEAAATIEEKEKALEESKKTIEEKDRVIEEMAKQIEELRKHGKF
jgi:chromosome segregation ATPase